MLAVQDKAETQRLYDLSPVQPPPGTPTANAMFESYHPVQNAVPEYQRDYTDRSQTLMDGWFLCPLWYQLECFHFFQPVWMVHADLLMHINFLLFQLYSKGKKHFKRICKKQEVQKGQLKLKFEASLQLRGKKERKEMSCKIFLEDIYTKELFWLMQKELPTTDLPNTFRLPILWQNIPP